MSVPATGPADPFFGAGLLGETIMQIGSSTLGRGKPEFAGRGRYPTLRLTADR